MAKTTVASLKKSCKKRGLTGYSSLTKAQLLRKCGSPKKKSTKKRSSKKYPSLPQYTAPAVRSGTLSSPPKKKNPRKAGWLKWKALHPDPPESLGGKKDVPWVLSDDSPPAYDSLYSGESMAFGFRGVQRRCSKKRVSKCHRRSRICSKNTSRTRCRLSATKRRSRARASARRSYRKHRS